MAGSRGPQNTGADGGCPYKLAPGLGPNSHVVGLKSGGGRGRKGVVVGLAETLGARRAAGKPGAGVVATQLAIPALELKALWANWVETTGRAASRCRPLPFRHVSANLHGTQGLKMCHFQQKCANVP